MRPSVCRSVSLCVTRVLVWGDRPGVPLPAAAAEPAQFRGAFGEWGGGLSGSAPRHGAARGGELWPGRARELSSLAPTRAIRKPRSKTAVASPHRQPRTPCWWMYPTRGWRVAWSFGSALGGEGEREGRYKETAGLRPAGPGECQRERSGGGRGMNYELLGEEGLEGNNY